MAEGSADKIVIGTRGSQLALAQANEVRDKLTAAHGGLTVKIDVISTKGDRIIDRPLAEIGGKGLFTEEIEEKLSDGRIDIAVHSSKDMPTELPDGLELTCFLQREAPGDAFICKSVGKLADLAKGAVVGSSSLRRKALIKRLRPDIYVAEFRGNVQTRLAKLKRGEVEATLLAEAGLNRLDMADIIASRLDIEEFPPAPGQGAICIESRLGDTRIDALLTPLNHSETFTALAAERAYLKELDGSCRTPLAGHAVVDEGVLRFHGMILTPDGRTWHEAREEGGASDAAEIGREVAARLRAEASAGFFAEWA